MSAPNFDAMRDLFPIIASQHWTKELATARATPNKLSQQIAALPKAPRIVYDLQPTAEQLAEFDLRDKRGANGV